MTSRPTPVWIATKRVVLVHPDGSRIDGHIAIGKPYVLGGGEPGMNYESHCPVEITGLYSAELPPIGSGELSSLVNALGLVRALLQGFIADGGRVLDLADHDSEISVESLFAPVLSTRT